jgi:hypothetical protein
MLRHALIAEDFLVIAVRFSPDFEVYASFLVTIQQNIKVSAKHGWMTLLWLRRNSFSGLVSSNHCSQRTKAYAACVWQWFD